MRHPIDVYRATDTEDEYGDPQPGTFTKGITLLGLFAPSNPSEALEPGKNTVISGGVVYVRTSTKPDVRPTDQVEVAGKRYDIDGDIGHWDGMAGYRGLQFAVKRAS